MHIIILPPDGGAGARVRGCTAQVLDFLGYCCPAQGFIMAVTPCLQKKEVSPMRYGYFDDARREY
ncbi:MAG: hypothetical protein ACI4ML_07735, partial [Aristaeellaceae bacterium]